MITVRILGGKVSKLRIAEGLTQKQLAEKTKISKSYLCKIEGGERNVSVPVFMRLIDSLGLSFQW